MTSYKSNVLKHSIKKKSDEKAGRIVGAMEQIRTITLFPIIVQRHNSLSTYTKNNKIMKLLKAFRRKKLEEFTLKLSVIPYVMLLNSKGANQTYGRGRASNWTTNHEAVISM